MYRIRSIDRRLLLLGQVNSENLVPFHFSSSLVVKNMIDIHLFDICQSAIYAFHKSLLDFVLLQVTNKHLEVPAQSNFEYGP